MKNTILIHWVSLTLLCLISNICLYGQCYSAGYSTNSKDSWLSCQTSFNPNLSRGNTHWLQYDLGYIYELGATKFWNYNVTNLTGRGFKEIAIDYSVDGTNWSEIGTFQLPEATGATDYQGINGLDLSGHSARYILITAISNWDDGACAGLSEVRFEVSVPSDACGDYIVDQNIGGSSINTGIHYSDNPIESDGGIRKGGDVTFKSAKSITLKTGFLAEAGSQFSAEIESCHVLNALGKTPNKTITKLENNLMISDIKIYPNPTSHILNIEFGEMEITDLMIINSSGHEILRRSGRQNFNQIDVNQLPAGMYFINVISSQHKLFSKRFIKIGL